MAEPTLQPLVATSSTMKNSTAINPDPSLSHPADLNETATVPMQDEAVLLKGPFRSGSAMFSTELGNRAPRSLPAGPPFPPIVVHSNNMQGVARTAAMWRHKYCSYSLCIFPGCGWTIGDLWDDVDIHVDTSAFCQEVLKFIARENYRLASIYAQEWSQTHKDRLSLIGGDMRELYDTEDHLAIVNKIFVDNETKDYPRTFLWHALHIIRTNMIMMRKTEVAMTVADNAQALPIVDQLANKVPLLGSPADDRALPTANGTSIRSDTATSDAPGKEDSGRS